MPKTGAHKKEKNGQVQCKDPQEYLFWDGFRLGDVANRGIGRAVAGMVRGEEVEGGRSKWWH